MQIHATVRGTQYPGSPASHSPIAVATAIATASRMAWRANRSDSVRLCRSRDHGATANGAGGPVSARDLVGHGASTSCVARSNGSVTAVTNGRGTPAVVASVAACVMACDAPARPRLRSGTSSAAATWSITAADRRRRASAAGDSSVPNAISPRLASSASSMSASAHARVRPRVSPPDTWWYAPAGNMASPVAEIE